MPAKKKVVGSNIYVVVGMAYSVWGNGLNYGAEDPCQCEFLPRKGLSTQLH